VPADEAAEIAAEIRRRDGERFELELAGGLGAGRALMHGNLPRPTPFTAPRREARLLGGEPVATGGEER
jgi:glutathione-regulated potassium-efflux system protein KefB